MNSLFFRTKGFISKLTGAFAVVAVLSQLMVPMASIAHAVDTVAAVTEAPSITVTATKIVCNSETSLPNWGVGDNGAPSEITATTAIDFLATHEGCHLATGWDFQWADQNAQYPDDGDVHIGLMDGFQNFGSPTAGDGTTTVTIPLNGIEHVYVGEVQKPGYITYTAQASGNSDTVTAEMYCGDDIYNYDNFEGIGNTPYMAAIVPGHHYYCVAWNVAKEAAPAEGTGKLHMVKFIDGAQATSETANNKQFQLKFDENASVALKSDGWVPGDQSYEATTYSQPKGRVFTVTEKSTDTTGMRCEEGKQFALVGYSTGSTLAEAAAAPITVTTPTVTIDGDKFLIVHNTKCAEISPIEVDMCPNIDRIQSVVPDGYSLNNANECVLNTVVNNGGGGRRTGTSGSTGGSVAGTVLGASATAADNEGQVLGEQTSCGIYIDKFLRKGYKNDSKGVKKVQKFLNDYLKAGLTEDGDFGAKTEIALKKFQASENNQVLQPWGFKKPTGIFYLTTQTRVNNIMCPDLNLPIPTLIPIEKNPLAPKK